MHENSLRAYREEKPKLCRKQREVLAAVLRMSKYPTDREVKEAMGFDDMNKVRPRITELVEFGYLEEKGDVQCKTTRKNVRTVGEASPKPMHQGDLPNLLIL